MIRQSDLQQPALENIASFVPLNPGTAPVIATVTITPHFTNNLVTCDGPTESFTITVNPTAQVDVIANQVLCNGSNTAPVTFTTINTVGTTTYTWTNTATSIGLAASGIGQHTFICCTEFRNPAVVATITVTPHFSKQSCNMQWSYKIVYNNC